LYELFLLSRLFIYFPKNARFLAEQSSAHKQQHRRSQKQLTAVL